MSLRCVLVLACVFLTAACALQQLQREIETLSEQRSTAQADFAAARRECIEAQDRTRCADAAEAQDQVARLDAMIAGREEELRARRAGILSSIGQGLSGGPELNCRTSPDGAGGSRTTCR